MISKKPALLMLICFCAILRQNNVFPGPPGELAGLLRPSIDYGAEKVFYADIKGSAPKVEVDKQTLKVSYYGFSLSYRLSSYNWRGEHDTGFSAADGAPWKELHNVMLSARGFYPISGTLTLMGGIRAYSGFERRLSRSLGGGADLALIKQLSDNWQGAAGVGAAWHPVGSNLMPVLALRYDSENEKGFSGSIGMPTGIKYRVKEGLAASAGVVPAAGTYRLKDNSPASKKGYFRHRAIVTRLGVEYNPTDNLELNVFGLYYIEREWRLYDRRGSRIERARLDSGPGMTAGAIWRF